MNTNLTNRTKGALERIAAQEQRVIALEQGVASLTTGISRKLSQLEQESSNMAEILNACVGALGQDVVGKAVVEARIEKLKAQAEENKARVAAAVAEGKLVVAEEVSPVSIIVGREFAKDSTEPNPPGVIYINFNAVEPSLQPQLLSKKVGESIGTPPGGKFEVLEVYDPAPVSATLEATTPAEAPATVPASTPEETDARMLEELGVSANQDTVQ